MSKPDFTVQVGELLQCACCEPPWLMCPDCSFEMYKLPTLFPHTGKCESCGATVRVLPDGSAGPKRQGAR